MEIEHEVHLPEWVPNTIQSRQDTTQLEYLINDINSVPFETSDSSFHLWVRGYWANRQQDTRTIAEKIAAMRKQ